MSGVNKVILVGNLGRDPELKRLSGSVLCNLSVATSRRYKNKAGEQVEETEWHRVTAWDKTAEHCAEYLSKGRQVYVEGRLRTRQYEAKDGGKRYSTEVVADTVQFLGGRGVENKSAPTPDGPAEDYPPPHLVDDDIPF